MYLCLFFYTTLATAQTTTIADSLQQLLQVAKNTPTKVDLLNDLAWEYKISDPDLARKHLQEAINLAEQLSYKKGEGQAYNNLGVVETIHDNKKLAIQHYQKALAIRESLDDQKGVASLYNNIGNLYAEEDSFVVAIANLKSSLQLREQLKDTQRIARVHYNLADAYESWGDYETALNHAFSYREWSAFTNDPYSLLYAHSLMGNIYTELERWEEAGENFTKAKDQAEHLEDDWEIITTYNNMGNHLDDVGENATKKGDYIKANRTLREAIRFHEKALALRKKVEDEISIGDSYNNLGVVYKNYGSYYRDLNQKDSTAFCFQKALQYFDQSLAIRTAAENQQGIMEVFNGIGDVKRRQGYFEEAIDYTSRYLAIAENTGDEKFKQKGYKDLARVYAETKRYKLAYEYQKKYDDLRYKRLDEDRTRINAQRAALYGDRTKELELSNQKLELERKESELRQATTQRRALAGGGIAMLLLALLLYNRYRIKNRANKALEEKNEIIESERQKSDGLLLNILPDAIAKELKANNRTSARRYESVSVLFTDFKSFTQVTEQMTAEELVALLDRCYKAFDEIITRHGIEKIKTIGDAYMCAAGLPTPDKHHAHHLVTAGLEMQEAMYRINEERKVANLPILQMRVGIHSGSVVAGVVGSKKFAYDIWGDAVNLAARMESSGEVDKVNISSETYELVKNNFSCTYRGGVKAKNKGEIDMYFVEKAAN